MNLLSTNLDYKVIKHRVNVVLFFLVFIQPFMWLHTKEHLPSLDILSETPNENVLKIKSLGDEQFYFRYLCLDLQNSGDSSPH
jgi:hypothetical protein